MPDWHAIVERAVDRNRVSTTLTRYGSPDVEVAIAMSPIQFTDRAEATGGSTTQQVTRWMAPARRLAATGLPLPPRVGDVLAVPSLGLQARVLVAAPGFAGGEVVRWDLTIEGPA